MAAKYGSPYFANYVNSDMNPSDVRSMAILGTQCVIYRDGDGKVSKNEIRHLVCNWIEAPENAKPKYEMLMNGKFVPVIDMFKVPYEKYPTYVEIETEMGVNQPFSYDHRCPIIRNGEYMEVMSQDVVPGDKLLLARHAYNDGTDSKDCPGDYDTGKIVGLYLAEGWTAHNGCEIIFAINEERDDLVSFITDYFQALACRVTSIHDPNGHIFKVHVYGLAASGLVKQFISGDKATEKRLTYYVFDTTADFRRGLYDGYLITDGSPKNNLLAHTTNKKLCSDLIILGATIGRYVSYSVNTKNTRYFKPDRSDKEEFTSYRLTIASPEVYNEDFYLVDVRKVTQLSSKAEYVYNFTVDTKEHLYTLPNGIITHQCCRLRLDLRDLRRRNGGFFGAGESTGSVGVVTLNLPHIAYISKTEDEFWANLDHYMDVAARSLDVKRDVITKLLNSGLYPYTKAYLGSFDNHFSTIGLVGGNEMCLNAKWLGKDLTHKESQDFVERMLNHMRNRLADYQEKYAPALFNLEATPAESTAYRFAKHDKERFPDIITANDHGTPYYTNSTNLPVGTTDDVFDALDIQDRFQPLYTSGTVFHTFLGEKLPSWESAAQLVRTICSNYKLPYLSLTPTYSICPEHGYIAGEHFTCPKCGGETEVYSRITGYYRPVKNWNDGKAQEFKDRKEYVIGSGKAVTKPIAGKDEAQAEPEPVCESCKVEANIPAEAADAASGEAAGATAGNLLFTTPTCPNCKIAKAALDKNGVRYQVVDATAEPELARKYGVMSAPTMISGKDGAKYTGAGAIIGNVAKLK